MVDSEGPSVLTYTYLNHYLININTMHETAVNRIVALLLAQQKGEISTGEQEELDTWIKTSESNQLFVERCLDLAKIADSLGYMDTINEEVAFQQFKKKNELNQAPIVSFQKGVYHWVAAAIFIGVSVAGAFRWLDKPSQKALQEPIAVVSKGENIQPGTNKATLTLSDGRTISLNDSKDGILVREGGAAANKQGNELVYNPAQGSAQANDNKIIPYHTVTTPRGGNYELTLPDKTKVWLNADASIRYPTTFTGRERRVEMTGEAYFEVTKKKANQPFIVTVNGVQVKVLGTHFNIRAYGEDESTKATLLEGSIEISALNANNPSSTVILKPGQQAAVETSTQFIKPAVQIPVHIVEVESIIAWKSGYFDFKATPITDIMKELKRWYAEVEIIDIKGPINDRLTATIPRNVPLSTMLTILEATGKVHFEVKGKNIIVTR